MKLSQIVGDGGVGPKCSSRLDNEAGSKQKQVLSVHVQKLSVNPKFSKKTNKKKLQVMTNQVKRKKHPRMK